MTAMRQTLMPARTRANRLDVETVSLAQAKPATMATKSMGTDVITTARGVRPVVPTVPTSISYASQEGSTRWAQAMALHRQRTL